ncbi:hypothetical protein KIN20_017943 [Parelaphostrongylus tenuis]|uniref:Uncharacterized protein n=1 Tax=Parelaphostrongylus tenuis TaxID=148309 RepID=A0AAD5MIK2_PARTN|nr:hypothetical protein KIN20_017943 [Parelaphostrongylus tenuis]
MDGEAAKSQFFLAESGGGVSNIPQEKQAKHPIFAENLQKLWLALTGHGPTGLQSLISNTGRRAPSFHIQPQRAIVRRSILGARNTEEIRQIVQRC